jgi:hypothetical protein
MHTRRVHSPVPSLLIIIAVGATACASPTEGEGAGWTASHLDDDEKEGPDGTTGAATEQTGDETGTPSASRDETPETEKEGVCRSSASDAECVACCKASEPAGFEAYLGVVRAQFCSPGVCKDECATSFCDGVVDGTPACLDCMGRRYGSLYDAIVSDCDSDAVCSRYKQCAAAACGERPK